MHSIFWWYSHFITLYW